ncbi:MAG: DHH family phosphoesterase [Flavobacteriales bacterium]|nr:DHH family phosphoesterase [Flavobacteriales bacterium]
MTDKEIEGIADLLSSKKRIAITTHQFPDGDAMGSSLALYHYLINKGHEVTVVVPTHYPEFLHWIPGNEGVVNYMSHQHKALDILEAAEVLFCLDYNEPSRTRGLSAPVANFKGIKILIDHHPEPADFVDYTLSETKASSTAELIYEFILMLKDEALIDKNVATGVYTGIMTDTGSFAYGFTTDRAHFIAGEMINAGANNRAIQNEIFNSNSEDRIRLMGHALSERLTVLTEFHTGFIALSKEDLIRFNFQNGDTEGLVNYIISIKGISFAVLMLEREQNVKCSFRSIGAFPANDVAQQHFKGGGHRNAAGGEYDGSLSDAVEHFRSVLVNFKAQLKD